MTTDARYSIESQTSLSEEQGMETCRATFDLEGMTCASCAMRIEKGLKKVPGVVDAQVNDVWPVRSSTQLEKTQACGKEGRHENGDGASQRSQFRRMRS